MKETEVATIYKTKLLRVQAWLDEGEQSFMISGSSRS